MNTFDSLFLSDESKSTNGVPVEIGYNAKNEKVVIFVAEAGNPKHEKSQRKYAKALENSRKNRDLYNEIICKIVAESILMGWEGVLDDKDVPLPPTYENKFSMLKKYRKFFLTVLDEAGNSSNFAVEDPNAEKDTEGN